MGRPSVGLVNCGRGVLSRGEARALLKGYQIYHNFVRPHEGLKGETPAAMAEIRVEGDNKWPTIIHEL
jgi:hypothetical protein